MTKSFHVHDADDGSVRYSPSRCQRHTSRCPLGLISREGRINHASLLAECACRLPFNVIRLDRELSVSRLLRILTVAGIHSLSIIIIAASRCPSEYMLHTLPRCRLEATAIVIERSAPGELISRVSRATTRLPVQRTTVLICLCTRHRSVHERRQTHIRWTTQQTHSQDTTSPRYSCPPLACPQTRAPHRPCSAARWTAWASTPSVRAGKQ